MNELNTQNIYAVNNGYFKFGELHNEQWTETASYGRVLSYIVVGLLNAWSYLFGRQDAVQLGHVPTKCLFS